MEYEDNDGGDATEIRKVLLLAARREWSFEERMRFIAIRDQARAEVMEMHPELKDHMPPMNY